MVLLWMTLAVGVRECEDDTVPPRLGGSGDPPPREGCVNGTGRMPRQQKGHAAPSNGHGMGAMNRAPTFPRSYPFTTPNCIPPHEELLLHHEHHDQRKDCRYRCDIHIHAQFRGRQPPLRCINLLIAGGTPAVPITLLVYWVRRRHEHIEFPPRDARGTDYIVSLPDGLFLRRRRCFGRSLKYRLSYQFTDWVLSLISELSLHHQEVPDVHRQRDGRYATHTTNLQRAVPEAGDGARTG